MLNLESAYANTGDRNGNIAAAKLLLNKWGYDMQLISGWYSGYAVVGCGWAGSIKEARFKGEMQYLFQNPESPDHLNLQSRQIRCLIRSGR